MQRARYVMAERTQRKITVTLIPKVANFLDFSLKKKVKSRSRTCPIYINVKISKELVRSGYMRIYPVP